MESLSPVTSLQKASIYREFILWIAMPPDEQKRLGIENQKQFADYHKIDPKTLWNWKQRPDFEKRIDSLLKIWSNERTPSVIRGIYQSAVKGNPLSQKLWLGYFKGYSERQTIETETKVEISVNDIRFLIACLPEPERTQANEHLRQIANLAQSGRERGRLDEIELPEHGFEDLLLGEANIDAQGISRPAANELASGYSECVCGDLVGPISAHNHQGSARWR